MKHSTIMSYLSSLYLNEIHTGRSFKAIQISRRAANELLQMGLIEHSLYLDGITITPTFKITEKGSNVYKQHAGSCEVTIKIEG